MVKDFDAHSSPQLKPGASSAQTAVMKIEEVEEHFTRPRDGSSTRMFRSER
jgi:hypothetical protein